MTRERFLSDAQKILVDLGGLIHDRLTVLLNQSGTTRDMQNRRDSWMLFQKKRSVWVEATIKVWRGSLRAPAGKPVEKKKEELSLAEDGGLSLVGTDAVENKILASRLVLSVVEKAGNELDDLRVRIKALENRDDLEGHDLFRPEVLILLMIEQWTFCGMPRESWPMVSDVVQKYLIDKLKAAYASANAFLIQQGIMPTIELKDRVKRAAVPRRPPPPPGAPPPDPMQTDPQPLGYVGDMGGGWVPSVPASYGASGYPQLAAYPQQGAYPTSGYGSPRPAVISAPAPLGAGAPPAMARGAGGAPMPPQAPGYGGTPPAPPAPAYPGQPQPMLGVAPAARSGGGGQPFGGRLGWDEGGAMPAPSAAGRGPAAAASAAFAAPMGQTPAQMHQAMAQAATSQFGGAQEETRLISQATPLARTRSRAQGMFGQFKRLLVGQGVADFGGTGPHPPSPALAAAMAQRPAASGTLYGDYSPAGVVRVAEMLREKTDELKQKAETKSEKAVIEMVALMFQAILAEERIPTTIRVWFARLQMPVLRVALSDADFFGSVNHPARQLIDRMGSCVLGFDATGISGSALEAEIKRVVQVIEQYPETGKRVFQIVHDEFQKFLAKFLTGKEKTQKVVSVAQQVEQKETLAIQYTIELRNMLKDIPVRDEIRNFLFKVWAEVLAVSAVRKGPKDVETVALKKAAADLVWSASAKPNRNDRARVIQDLPQLLQRLRGGMKLLGMSPTDQDAHIKIISDTMADAFMSKTQAIPQAQIDAMTQRLANLEDFVSEDGLGDLPLDAESIEMMLGIDASTIDVVTNGGSKPTPAMTAWAQELQVGSWFTLDHNGKVSQVQFVWRSDRKHLNLFSSSDGHSYLIQAGRLAAYLQAGLLLPQEEETLTVRATREALTRLEANPERLVT
ncbi:MAG: DUF1631 domain-containing protein [Curvibacter sp.]|nr:DUF1631 domain-containing protein [Curvibacter sp.]